MGEYSLREARTGDGEAILALMPRLAEFDVPETRNPDHLWGHDAEMFRDWLAGSRQCLVHVAVDEDDKVLGFTMVSLRPELLSDEPSAHLEAIALDRSAEGKGIAQALLKCAEDAAKAAGAESMTLHVFAVNQRARRLYEQAGYDGELMRYIKHL